MTNGAPRPSPADALRRAARRFVTGVTIVAVPNGDWAHALTANSFVTLSLEPALVGVAVRRDGRMRRLAEQVGVFWVSVLSGAQEQYATYYARRDRTDAPGHLALPGTPTPVVPGCIAYFGCELSEILPVGDHDLVVGAVAECGVPSTDRGPLIFLDGRFHEHRTMSEVVP